MGKYDRLRVAWPASLPPWQLRAVFGAKLGSGFGQLLKAEAGDGTCAAPPLLACDKAEPDEAATTAPGTVRKIEEHQNAKL
jgi:hypothetical protein